MMIKFCRLVLVLQVKGVGQLKVRGQWSDSDLNRPETDQILTRSITPLIRFSSASALLVIPKQERSLVNKEADSTSWRVSFFPNLIEPINGAQCRAKQRTKWHDPIRKVSPAL